MIRVVFLCLLLSGCQSIPYWTLTRAAFAITGVYFSDYPCGTRGLGCVYPNGRVELRSDLRNDDGSLSALGHCVFNHEKKHAEGYMHHDRLAFAVDCGDGTIYALGPRG